jgi:uncharacterized protein with von Willebrand factor type A (vWA) domain
MSRISKFAARDTGPSARIVGFFSHLRFNNLKLGVSEVETALTILGQINMNDPFEVRRSLKPLCVGNLDEARRFEDLFDSYWMDSGRVKRKVIPNGNVTGEEKKVSEAGDKAKDNSESSSGSPNEPDEDTAILNDQREGELVAVEETSKMHKDLREFVTNQEIDDAMEVAIKIGKALRDKRSRRLVRSKKGQVLDFRKTIRRSLSTGGEPFKLINKSKPDRPKRIVALCDVSGSMNVYSKIFLAFLSALMRNDQNTDAYLFHTELVRVSDALRDENTGRSMEKLSLLANGFGGGSRIGHSIKKFSKTYARRFVNSRSVVMVLSDGYDSNNVNDLVEALANLKKRGCKIIWLNPLKGWKDYEPVTASMVASLPYLDLFSAANTLNDLAALDGALEKL